MSERPSVPESAASVAGPSFTYTQIPRQQFSILKPWYNVAIMDLITCTDFKDDPEWIAARLGVTVAQARFALSELHSTGLIERRGESWKKSALHARMASQVSRAEIREFHAQMMDKAKEVLRTQTSLEEFALREISGLTIAANPAQLARAKQRLVEAIHEVAEILSEGECTEVYQLGVQLFPLTRKS